MTELKAALDTIDAHLKANPSPAVLDQWRRLRDYIATLDDQRWMYLAIGVAIGLALAVLIFAIGNTHPQ